MFNKSQTVNQVYRLVETTAFTFGRGDYGVGWDGRKSSSIIARGAISAIAAAGSTAIVFGLIPTPVVAFATMLKRCSAGFSVTASHNPPEFSGIKFFDGKGMELDERDELRVERALVVDSHKHSLRPGRVEMGDEAILEEYVEAILARFEPASRKLKIVIDCANGPGGLVTPLILTRLGHHVIALNAQMSWKFTGRPPEPTSENLRETAGIVRECGADLGLAHDGDADRLVMINSAGEIVQESIIPIIALRNIGAHAGVVALSENTSSCVEEEAKRIGFRVIRSKIGKTFTHIKDDGAVFACEPSKLVDSRWGLWEDGIYAAALISDAVAKDKSLIGLIDGGTGWRYRQINLPVAVNMEYLTKRAADVFGRFRISERRTEFGLKMIFKDGSWIMFRPSGTEAKTRVYCESRDFVVLEEMLEDGRKCVEASAISTS